MPAQLSCPSPAAAKERFPFIPVTGKVLVDGQPAAGAMVIFCPIEGSEQLMRERRWASRAPTARFN